MAECTAGLLFSFAGFFCTGNMEQDVLSAPPQPPVDYVAVQQVEALEKDNKCCCIDPAFIDLPVTLFFLERKPRSSIILDAGLPVDLLCLYKCYLPPPAAVGTFPFAFPQVRDLGHLPDLFYLYCCQQRAVIVRTGKRPDRRAIVCSFWRPTSAGRTFRVLGSPNAAAEKRNLVVRCKMTEASFQTMQ